MEHGVTEMVTGIDLIKEQILVSSGKKLSFSQDDIKINGCAIECRINAEDPYNNFMPCPGKIDEYIASGGIGIRVDSGVYSGYVIPPFYDSMISKLVSWGRNREEAIERMKRALDEFIIIWRGNNDKKKKIIDKYYDCRNMFKYIYQCKSICIR